MYIYFSETQLYSFLLFSELTGKSEDDVVTVATNRRGTVDWKKDCSFDPGSKSLKDRALGEEADDVNYELK